MRVEHTSLQVDRPTFWIPDPNGMLGHNQLVKITDQVPDVDFLFRFAGECQIPLHVFLP